MNKLIRWAAIVIGVLIALSVLLSVALLIFVDPNDYREEIATAVHEQTGRTLTIDGDLSLKTFPCCGVRLGPLAISNPEGFPGDEFAGVELASVSVRLGPLLIRQELQIGRIELKGLDLQLISLADGRVNWEFGEPAATTDTAESADTAATGLGKLDVAGIEISDSRIVYRDDATNELIELSDIQIFTSAIVPGQSFDFSADLQAEGLSPGVSSSVSLNSGAVLNDDLSLGLANTRAAISLSGADLPGGKVELQANIASTTDLGGERIELDGLDVVLQAVGVELQLSGAGALNDGAPDMAGKLRLNTFSPRKLLADLGEAVPVTADPAVLQKFTLDSDWSMVGDRAALENLGLSLDDSSAKGWIRIADINKDAVALDLQFDAIDLDRYLAPAEDADAAGGASTAVDDDALDLPVEDLRALDLQARLGFSKLKFSDARLTDVNINVAAKKGLIRLNPLTANLYAGSYAGDVQLDVRGQQPKMSVNEKISGVQLQGLLMDTAGEANLAGIANAGIQATASGNRVSELLQNLAGTTSLRMDEGKYLGVDLWYEIRKARAAFKGEQPPAAPAEPYTDISEVSATARFKDGLLSNDDLRAQIPFIRLGGKGTVNLLESAMDYRLEASVVSRPQFSGGENLDDLNGVVLPVTLKGPMEAPTVSVDIASVAVSMGQKKLMDRLQKKLGGSESQEGAEPEEGDKKSESSKDQLKRGLLDLIGG